MRLIDAEKLINEGWVLTRHGVSNCLIGIKSIADVPTAFDIDYIIKKLDELDDTALEEYHNTYAGTYEHDFAEGKSVAFEIAIGIVKEGGIKNE